MSRILVIEDDPFLAKLYQDILKPAGYQVEVAEDGKSGEKMIKKQLPDLLLLDIMLPKMNGLDLLENLRKQPETKDLNVVIITNLASEADQERAERLGVSKYLIKTQYDPKQVVEIIKEVLQP